MTETLREARIHVSDDSIRDPETPALLRRIAGVRVVVDAAEAEAFEVVAPSPRAVPGDFVLVDFEIRPGVRSYRLVRRPKNDPWRIRIGAFERRVHRAFVVLARRFARGLTAPVAIVRVLPFRPFRSSAFASLSEPSRPPAISAGPVLAGLRSP